MTKVEQHTRVEHVRPSSPPLPPQVYTLEQVAQHTDPEAGVWLVIDNLVYDV